MDVNIKKGVCGIVGPGTEVWPFLNRLSLLSVYYTPGKSIKHPHT